MLRFGGISCILFLTWAGTGCDSRLETEEHDFTDAVIFALRHAEDVAAPSGYDEVVDGSGSAPIDIQRIADEFGLNLVSKGAPLPPSSTGRVVIDSAGYAQNGDILIELTFDRRLPDLYGHGRIYRLAATADDSFRLMDYKITWES